MNNVLTIETNKYEIKIENFEGPLDLLCHLVDKNKMDIFNISIDQITNQYIEYLNKMEEMNLDIASEFLIMATNLVYLKSKFLLPNEIEDESELTQEELIRRIIEYKKYKDITDKLKENYLEFSDRFFKLPDIVELPKQKLNKTYDKELIPELYSSIIQRNKEKINTNADNIKKIAITETITVSSKVKEIFKELVKRPKFVFNKLFSIKKCKKLEIVTAFTGVLELTRRNKIVANQEKIFGDIIIEKAKK